jgi:hypothetical protein
MRSSTAPAMARFPRVQAGPYKPATVRGYDEALRLRVLPELGHMRLSEVQRADVQDFADRLTGEGLSASTMQIRGKRSQADAGTRTPDPFITSEVLYQLSYVGAV